MAGCGCNDSLIGGRKRRQIGKRTRKNKRGGGWLDDLKARIMPSDTNVTTSDPFASEPKTSWWGSLTNRFMPSKEKSVDTTYSSSYPSYSSENTAGLNNNPSYAYGGNKSRKRKGLHGGTRGCSMYKNKSKKNGRSSTRKSRK